LERTYFLYINRTKTVIELDKGDLQTVMEYCARQVRQNPSTAAVLSSAQRRLNISEGNRVTSEMHHHLNQDLLWQRLLDHFRSQRTNFNLQNIEFCVEKLFGLAKYPINVWNQLELTNNDLKFNLNTQKSKLSFFLKSAVSIINATSMQFVLFGHTQKALGAGVTGQSPLAPAAQTKREQQSAAAETKVADILAGRVITLDGVFQRMVKVNNLERNELDSVPGKNAGRGFSFSTTGNIFTNNEQKLNQLDQLSVNQISTKHMDYNQVMVALG
jgi:hypothetical protein